MTATSQHLLCTAAGTIALLTAFKFFGAGYFRNLIRWRKMAPWSPRRQKLVPDSSEREDLSRAIAGKMALVDDSEDKNFLKRLYEKVQCLETKILANQVAMEELTDTLEDALSRHQQQTAVTLTPLQNDVLQLKESLAALAALLDTSKTTSAIPERSSELSEQKRAKEQGEDGGSGIFGTGAMETQFSHLTTVATALGIKPRFMEGGRSGCAEGSFPSYIISDWSELSTR
ncbi:hypothetical protein NSK_003533 [Nannochloropsis salina CCMP1776]|uniref:Uncharacterized protein n=1 Tax=Nannochloropsis salina CCMP1776 TaxID=1027361 RepID=A0A4D9D131_9STRA|nr:hypothetical protein NSK_003533 [Nannochloropsis salina CCMP1776]|eukprot:TFJ85110.1 hypothetical protein NSK_003533 [Nannochloropsis salina CCMP1776]